MEVAAGGEDRDAEDQAVSTFLDEKWEDPSESEVRSKCQICRRRPVEHNKRRCVRYQRNVGHICCWEPVHGLCCVECFCERSDINCTGDEPIGDLRAATKRYPDGLPFNVVENEMFFLDEYMQKTYPGNRTRQKNLLGLLLETFPETYEKILARFNLREPYKHRLFRLLLDEIGSRYNVVSLTDATGCFLLTDAARRRGVALRPCPLVLSRLDAL
jgi:hypothetical protein